VRIVNCLDGDKALQGGFKRKVLIKDLKLYAFYLEVWQELKLLTSFYSKKVEISKWIINSLKI